MNITSNTTSEFPDRWTGGPGRLSLTGAFDGATAKLAFHNGDDWVPFGDDAAFTADGGCAFEASSQDRLAVITADGGGSLNIDAKVEYKQ